MATTGGNLELALRIQADLGQAREQLRRLQGEVSGLGRSADIAAAGSNRLSQSLERVARYGVAGAGLLAVASALKGIAGGFAAVTGQATDLQSRLQLAVGGAVAGAQAMDRLGEMARRTYSDFAGTVESFLGMSGALKELGYETGQQLDFVKALNNALVVSGAKAERAAQVQGALSRAMALGTLEGQNLNSVIQSGGRVAELLAKQLGVGVNQLRALGAEGKITGDVIYKALAGNLEQVRAEAEAMPATIADGMLLLRDAAGSAVVALDNVLGVSQGVSGALVGLADGVSAVGRAAQDNQALTLGMMGALSGASAAAALKMLGSLGGAMAETAQASRLAAAQAAAQAAAEATGNELVTQTSRQKLAAYLAELQAKVAQAKTAAAAQAAQIATLATTREVIVAARAEVVAKMASVRATMAQAEAQIAAAKAAGALSYALAAVREGTQALTAAQAQHARLVNELAMLGRQQAGVQAAVVAATNAQTAATGAAATATSSLNAAQRAASASAGAMGRVIGALGGPIGIAIAAAGALVGMLISAQREANALARVGQAQERTAAALAAGRQAEERDVARLRARLEELKDKRDELLLKQKDIGFFGKAISRDLALASDLKYLDRDIAALEKTLAGIGTTGQDAGTQVQGAANAAAAAWEKSLAGVRTASSVQREYEERLQASRAALVALQKAGADDATLAKAQERQLEYEKALTAERDRQLKSLTGERAARAKLTDTTAEAYKSQLAQLTQARAQAEQALANAQAGVASTQNQSTDRLQIWLQTSKEAQSLDGARVQQLQALAQQIDKTAAATRALQEAQQRTSRIDAAMPGVEQALLQAQGKSAEAAVQQLQARWAQLRADLTADGNTQGLVQLDKLMGIERASAQLQQLQEQAQRIFAEQARAEQSIANQVTAGLVGELQAKQQILQLNSSTADQVQQLLPQMRELAALTGNPQLADGVAALELRVTGLRTQANELRTAFTDVFGNSMSSTLSDLASGTITLGEAVRDFLNNLAQGMAQWAAQQLAMRAQSGLLELFNQGAGAAAGAAGGAVAGAADAGQAAAAAAQTAATTAATAATVADTAATAAATASTAALTAAATAATVSLQALAAASASSGGSSLLGAAAKAYGFASGGYTGAGGKYQPAGIVHAEEFVNRREVVRQPGALAFLTEFNRVGMAALNRWPGYADGGLVVGGRALQGIPSAASYNPPSVVGSSTTVDNRLALNLIDDPARIAEVIGSKQGEAAFTVMLSRNPGKFRQLLGVS